MPVLFDDDALPDGAWEERFDVDSARLGQVDLQTVNVLSALQALLPEAMIAMLRQQQVGGAT